MCPPRCACVRVIRSGYASSTAWTRRPTCTLTACPSRRSAGRIMCSCTSRPDARRNTLSELHVAPGRAQDYEILIPSTHPPGLYWYHPHPHGHSDDQVRNGMSGALIVEGLLDPFPELRNVPEHVLLLKDAQIGDGHIVHRGIGDDVIRTVNGMLNPT